MVGDEGNLLVNLEGQTCDGFRVGRGGGLILGLRGTKITRLTSERGTSLSRLTEGEGGEKGSRHG